MNIIIIIKRVIFILLSGFILIILSYGLFLYFFLRSAPPIEKYELTNISYKELDNRINKFSVIHGNIVTSPEFRILNKQKFVYQSIILGKDSMSYLYKYSISNTQEVNCIRLYGIERKKADRYGNLSYGYKSYDDSLGLREIFEKEFIDKIKKGE